MATAGALPSPAVQWTYTLPFPSATAHSSDETALGKLLRNESGSKSLAYQYSKYSKL